MKSIFIITFSFIFIIISFSQKDSTIKNDNIVFGAHPEIRAQYIGGPLKLMNDIKKNLKYPNSQGSISGRVYVSFIIDTLGQVSNVKIARGISDEFDKEAIRVVKLLNNWIPGTQRGKKIVTKYTVPIRFDF
jgi:TonB family protein